MSDEDRPITAARTEDDAAEGALRPRYLRRPRTFLLTPARRVAGKPRRCPP